ncbi:tripartite tricarboxylate transporter substrate binding protein [Ramlibacter sp. AW1]|uniref:Tripartite tricarboxylate transporter substrate binding protein n=2 Tax=Ramlibacter aurantiacus TaxID=2801330 RepID=A0A936ZNS2_9BURK|nr:tripartite tricarboxylate transporter substrate binding protein [Ramlibacter aurantiacus]
MQRRRVLQGLAALAAAPSLLHAQGSAPPYPQKTVRIVVPYTTGGSNDVIARVVGQKLQDAWGQPVVVENKPGAAGNIGAGEVARAPGDGYTLLLTNINITSMNPALIPRMPFDPQKDFAPISLLGTTSMVLVVHPSVPVQNTAELIKYLRERPGKLSYASSGNGSPQHMSAEMFKSMTGTRVVHIPYRGAAPAVTDVVGGQVEMTFGVINQLLPHIRAGRVKPIAVTSSKRLPSVPELPTLDESGVKGYESEIWLGLAAPAGTPAPIIDKINQEVRKIMAEPEIVSRLGGQGIDVLVSTPEQMRQRADQDLKRWSQIIKSAGIQSQ